jgi:hypothetical protein
MADGIPNLAWTSIEQISGTHFYLCKAEGIHQVGSNDLVGIYVSAGNKAYFTHVQLEDKKYATSLTSGQRNNMGIIFEPYSVRTWSAWVKSTSNKVVDNSDSGNIRTLFFQENMAATTYYWQLIVAPTNSSYGHTAGTAALVTGGLGGAHCNVPNINIIDGKWHHITVEHGVTGMNGTGVVTRLWVDGQYAETTNLSAYTDYPACFNGKLYLGHRKGDIGCNFIFDELRVDPRNYHPDNIRHRYLSDTEYYNPFNYGIIV